MKRLNYLFGLALILLGFSWASAETVTNYTVDFNTSINTSDKNFKVAPGWKHIATTSYYGTSYTYNATGGVDGTGALQCGTQNSSSLDYLVTPAITGDISLMCKLTSNYGASRGITFYAITEADDGTLTPGDVLLAKVGDDSGLTNTEFTEVTLTGLNGQRVGIVGYNVIMDDFVVEGSANIELERALQMNSVTLDGSTSRDCDAEGNFSFTYTVKFTNVGEVALDNTMDNYTLTLGAVKYVSGSGYVIDEEKILTSVPIEAASIAIGEQVTQVIEVTANISSPAFGGNGARSRIDVREDISGTSATGSWIEPIKYEAILTVRNSNGNDLIEYPSYAAAFGSFGMVNENVSKVLELRNSGAAPAEVTLTAPEGFTAEPATITVAAHSSENVTITVDASTPGIKSGNLVIASNGLAEDFALVLSATVLDPNKYFEGFEDNKPSTAIPAGWYDVDNNWSKTSNTNGDNNYVSSSSEGEHKLITPLLKVAEGEKMSFEARKKTASSNTSSYINVYYSADRKNWTLAKEISKDDLDVNTFTTFVLEGVPAGNNYIAFQSGYCAIDNVYGFELVPVAHDVVVKDFKVPTTAMANNDVTATVTLQNLLGEAETEYAPTLYFDGTEVATAEAVEIPANGTATATVEFTFVANEVGTFPAKAEFVFSEDYTVTTDEVEVTVTPESADALVQVGEATSTGSNVPLYMLYNNSESQTIYTAEQLGLKAGAKITSLTYKGYCTGSKTLSPTVTVWIENTEATAPMVNEGKLFDTEGMTQVFEDVCTVEPKGSYSEHVDMLAFNLNEPFEYTGGNLKVIVRSLYTDYMTVYFEADGNVSGQSIYRCEDVQTTFLEGVITGYKAGSANLPVVYLGVQQEPAVYSGVVTDNDGNALEGVTVTLTSQMPEGVEGAPRRAATAGPAVYTATTDAEGKFSVEVIQTDKIYNANFAKEGYKDVNIEGVDFANGNVVLQEPVVMEPDAVTGVQSMNAGKAVAGVKYYNVAGQASDKAFKGVNIVVTTYTDGTTSAVKVVK